MNEKPLKTISLTDEQRAALEAICRRRKVDARVSAVGCRRIRQHGIPKRQ
jgi:hypothetical protein